MRNLFVNKINEDEIFTLVQDEGLGRQNSKPSTLDVSQCSEHVYGVHTNLIPIVSLYTPWKHHKTSCFFMFLEGIQRESGNKWVSTSKS